MDIKQSNEADDVGSTIRRFLHEWYGQDVKAIMIWLPPGTTKLDVYTNIFDQTALVETLRGVVQKLESTSLLDLMTRNH